MANVKLVTYLKCTECECEVYGCPSCESTFQEDDEIQCTEDEHYCEQCNIVEPLYEEGDDLK